MVASHPALLTTAAGSVLLVQMCVVCMRVRPQACDCCCHGHVSGANPFQRTADMPSCCLQHQVKPAAGASGPGGWLLLDDANATEVCPKFSFLALSP